MAKGMDTGRGEGWPLVQSTPKIMAFCLEIMEKMFSFVCWIMVLFSLHTLKKCFDIRALFSKKKNQRQILSLQNSVNEENCGLKVVNPSLKPLRFLGALTSKGRALSRAARWRNILSLLAKSLRNQYDFFLPGLMKGAQRALKSVELKPSGTLFNKAEAENAELGHGGESCRAM